MKAKIDFPYEPIHKSRITVKESDPELNALYFLLFWAGVGLFATIGIITVGVFVWNFIAPRFL